MAMDSAKLNFPGPHIHVFSRHLLNTAYHLSLCWVIWTQLWPRWTWSQPSQTDSLEQISLSPILFLKTIQGMALVEQKLKVKSVVRSLFKELWVAGEHIYISHLSQPRWKVYSSLKRYSEMPQDQIREEKPMGPLWSSKHLLRSSSAVLSAFIDGAFLDLRHSHIAVPTLLIRDFKHKEVQMTGFRPDC